MCLQNEENQKKEKKIYEAAQSLTSDLGPIFELLTQAKFTEIVLQTLKSLQLLLTSNIKLSWQLKNTCFHNKNWAFPLFPYTFPSVSILFLLDRIPSDQKIASSNKHMDVFCRVRNAW